MTREALFDLDPATHARREDPDTSHAAAAQLSDKAAMMRRLLSAYSWAPDGLTAEEAATFAGYAPADGAWKRVSDLSARGWIEDTGRRRYASTGRLQIVRGITHAGRQALR